MYILNMNTYKIKYYCVFLIFLFGIVFLNFNVFVKPKSIEEFKPFRIFYNKNHKKLRRKINPVVGKIKFHWERFIKKWW